MLTELKVSQFAIIDKIHIQFEDGLNILSGETGAGKSILIKSLSLLMGAKTSSQDIRSNKDKATIEGAFDLSSRDDIVEKLNEIGIDSDEPLLIVRRQIHKNGKSRVYLNGSLSTVGDLRKIVFPLITMSNPTEAPLVEITGQHENKDLLSARYQMDVLDQFCGNLDLRAEISENYAHLKEIEQKISDLENLSQQREQQIDFLQFQINEIEDLDLQDNEDEELKNQIKELKTQGQWMEWVNNSLNRLTQFDQSAINQLRLILQTSPDSDRLSPIKDQIKDALNNLEDVAFQLQGLNSNEGLDDTELEKMEERLSRIRKLQKKFGDPIDEILSRLDEMKKEFHELTHLSQTLDELSQQYKEITAKMISLSVKLNKKRTTGGELLSTEVNNELKDLNMKGLKFLIEIESINEIQSTGIDRVIFRTKTGAKDEARDLAKAASGGELSRILLSLKQVIGSQQFPRTFLFDEVDTGVSGPTAEKVGAKLKNLAGHQQVLCVTHLPQVASFGDHHFYIEKNNSKDTVEMSVKKLKKSERVDEIARLISGEKITKTSRAHAKELLGQSI